jgi:hypothetical protein
MIGSLKIFAKDDSPVQIWGALVERAPYLHIGITGHSQIGSTSSPDSSSFSVNRSRAAGNL